MPNDHRDTGETGVGISRRGLLTAAGVAIAGGALAGPLRSQLTVLAHAERQPSILAPLGAPDAWGVRVPTGFTARTIALTGEPVGTTSYEWHPAPDGGACFGLPDGGHVYVSNSEVGGDSGGVGAVEFDRDGRVRDARRILDGTNFNCSGGATPWGTWLSCEENGPNGIVWECDPVGGPAHPLPALGRFNHEAAAIDPATGFVYLTEDDPNGRLYRFTPDRVGELTTGRLQAAAVESGRVSWIDVGVDAPERTTATTPFAGGEGAVIDHGRLLFVTKLDKRVWDLDLESWEVSVMFDVRDDRDSPLTHLDGIAVHPSTGFVFVAEDGGDMGLCVLTEWNGTPIVEQVVEFVGHVGSEVTGPAFSPDGRRLYLSSQRGIDGRGVTVEVTGPFDEFAQHVRGVDGGASVGRRAERLGRT